MKFWTDNTLSLIRIGRGYWKYTPHKECIHFETQYDYDTRFGRIGNVIDSYMFRPLLGWATAWSFDALKLWLEKGLHPSLLIRRMMTYWLVCFLFAFVWIYQGIVPKIIFSHPEEVKMLSLLIGSHESSVFILKMIGILEIIFGAIWLFPLPKRKIFIMHIVMLIAVTVAAGCTNIASFTEPFNPITLNLLLIGLSIVGYLNSFDLPSAKNCKRTRKGKCMTNIYERLLGDSYKKLHPKLQKRYEVTEENSFIGEGKMDEIYGGSFFVKMILKIAAKFRMFFSERGQEVPFTIHNYAERDEHGNEFVRWNRTFYFHNKKRYFNAVMQLDEEKHEIVDYFGEPHLLVSTLNFHIDEVGGMHISSKNNGFIC